MKKLSKIITIIVIIILISISIWVFFKNKYESNELSNSNIKQEAPGIGGDGPESFYGWKEKLDIKTLQLIGTVFDENYKFVYDETGKYIITLEEIKEKYYIGFEYLNTNTIKCNLKTSYFKAYVDEGEQLRSVNLECKNIDE